MRKKTILPLLLVVTPAMAAQKRLQTGGEEQEIAYREIFLTPYQEQTLEDDLPLRDLALTNGALWMLGQKLVWYLDLRTRKMRKYDLDLPTANTFLAREMGDGTVYFASDQVLFALQASPKLIKHFAQKLSLVVDFTVLPSYFVWFTASGIYFQHRETAKLQHLAYNIQQDDRVFVAPSRKSIWLVRGQDLLRVSSRDKQEEKILSAANLKLAGGPDSLFIGRESTLLRYSYGGNLAQVVPVAGKRELMAMHIAPGGHSYIFNDGLFEYYRTKERTVLRTDLKLMSTQTITHLDVFASRLAFITAGKPRAFVLIKKPASS